MNVLWRISDEGMTEAIDKMDKTVDQFYDSIRCIRSGGITTSLIDSVKVEAYGQQMPIKHLAMTTGRGNQSISIKPHDPNLVAAINKTLWKEGFQSYIFSKDTVCVPVPPISGEDREKTKQHIRKLGEDAKIAIRNIRKQCRKTLEAASEDDLARLEKELQKVTDESIEIIVQVVEEKTAKL